MVPFWAEMERTDAARMENAAKSLLIFIFDNAVKAPVNEIGVVDIVECEKIGFCKKFGRTAGKDRQSIIAGSTVIVFKLRA